MDNQNQEDDTNRALSDVQIEGIQEYGLSIAQVTTPNFGLHTLDGIDSLNTGEENPSIDQAFEKLSGLDEDQVQGITRFDLLPDQVSTPNFGAHTLAAITNLKAGASDKGQELSNQEAFAEVSGLNAVQVRGLTAFDLSRDDVQTNNFGMHTLVLMNDLQQENQDLSNQEIFDVINGIDAVLAKDFTSLQFEGIYEYGLSVAQVTTPNFGLHTLDGIDSLNIGEENPSVDQAFEKLSGLDEDQVQGITRFDLLPDQVSTPNFGAHTLAAITNLKAGASDEGQELSNQEAFAEVSGLNAVEVRGITEFQLNREQVLDPRFSEHTLRNIQILQVINPEATKQHLFDSAMELPEYQIRGLSKLNLLPEQVGLGVEGNQFVQLENELSISGKTIDAIDHLVSSEGMNQEEALETALQLDSTQIIGMIELGLILEQVQHPSFQERENIIEELIAFIDIDADSIAADGFDFPLSKEQQQDIREVMTGIILTSDTVDHLVSSKGMDQEQAVEAAMELDTIQMNGIMNLGLSLEQVQHTYFQETEDIIERLMSFIGIDADEFDILLNEEQQQEIREVMTGTMLASDTASHLMSSKGINQEQALETAMELDTTQMAGIVNMGLSLQQVQHTSFQDKDTIIEELKNAIGIAADKFDLPLNEEQQQNVREVMTGIISTANTSQSIQQQETVTGENQAKVPLNENTNLYQTLESENGSGTEIDLTAFTKTISKENAREKSLKRSRSDDSAENLKPAAKKNDQDKKSVRKIRKP
ncbi:hypothetical protein [Ascidiimonas sp. W6]|uniref:hypothetical protein n=1 Tax=Ascidiimonas meishanensis TaxID=3128903 RepID=UPI0030EF63C3